jgi:hypothetical protein
MFVHLPSSPVFSRETYSRQLRDSLKSSSRQTFFSSKTSKKSPTRLQAEPYPITKVMILPRESPWLLPSKSASSLSTSSKPSNYSFLKINESHLRQQRKSVSPFQFSALGNSCKPVIGVSKKLHIRGLNQSALNKRSTL